MLTRKRIGRYEPVYLVLYKYYHLHLCERITMPRETHEPGYNSVDDSNPTRQSDGTWVIRWRFWPYDGGKSKPYRHQGATKGEALAKARAKAAELTIGRDHATWTPSSKVSEFIDKVSTPSIENDARLRDSSRARYLAVIKYAVGECTRHDHPASLAGRTLHDITHHQDAFIRLEACVLEVARLHGSETARQMRNVIEKHLMKQLIRHGLIRQHENPLAGMPIAYGTNKTTNKPSGGHALAEADYDRVLAYLLAIDPAEGAVKPKRGPYTLDDRIAMRRNIVDATLLQAVTGMRITETCTVEPHEVKDNAQGGVNIYIPPEKAKTGVARTVTVLDARVAARIRDRRDGAVTGQYIIGAPSDPTKRWEPSNRDKRARALYKEMSVSLGIDLMEAEFRSHGWRTTLNMLYNHLPDHIRASWFGHGVDVNHSNYSDSSVDLSAMVTAATDRKSRHLRAVGE